MILVETGRVNKSKLSSENNKSKKSSNTPTDASMQDENSADENEATLLEDKHDEKMNTVKDENNVVLQVSVSFHYLITS